jgi:nucleoside-diphosphate-sugar epimerase
MYSLKRKLFLTDLDYVYKGVGTNWTQLKGRSILITGGTGIIGKWLLSTILHADDCLNIGVRIYILSRNIQSLEDNFPELFLDERVVLIQGDVRNFTFPSIENLSHIIHAATDVISEAHPMDILDACFNGTRNVLNQGDACGIRRMLLVSSGSVYGKASPNMGPIPETYSGPLAFQAPDSAYAQGKRISELLCSLNYKGISEGISIARCFAMVGPYLPLNKHFAIGNFIESAIEGNEIVINGNGTPIRSYLYMADVVLRIWVLLFCGKSSQAYNVGSNVPITISELARLVIKVTGSNIDIITMGREIHGAHASHYYPNTNLIDAEYGLSPQISLDDAIIRTIKWYELNEGVVR